MRGKSTERAAKFASSDLSSENPQQAPFHSVMETEKLCPKRPITEEGGRRREAKYANTNGKKNNQGLFDLLRSGHGARLHPPRFAIGFNHLEKNNTPKKKRKTSSERIGER